MNNTELSLMIATPAYGGQVGTGYVNSLLNLSWFLQDQKIRHEVACHHGGALITHARNLLANKFYFSPRKHTHLLFLDADMVFRAQDILALLRAEKDLVGLPYAYKGILWNRVADGAQRGMHPAELERIAPVIKVSRLPETEGNISPGAAWEVAHIDCGLMLIARSVFDRFAQTHHDRKFRVDPHELPLVGSDWAYQFFRTSIHKETQQFRCEDWTFCEEWREMGGKVFLLPDAVTGHQNGSFEYVCDLQAIGRAGLGLEYS